jgi:hypothetical protein
MLLLSKIKALKAPTRASSALLEGVTRSNL